jgi:hypothetical protein
MHLGLIIGVLRRYANGESLASSLNFSPSACQFQNTSRRLRNLL